MLPHLHQAKLYAEPTEVLVERDSYRMRAQMINVIVREEVGVVGWKHSIEATWQHRCHFQTFLYAIHSLHPTPQTIPSTHSHPLDTVAI